MVDVDCTTVGAEWKVYDSLALDISVALKLGRVVSSLWAVQCVRERFRNCWFASRDHTSRFSFRSFINMSSYKEVTF